MEEKELEQVSKFNNSEKEVAKFRQEVPIEVLENKRLRRAFGIRIPPRKLFPKIAENAAASLWKHSARQVERHIARRNIPLLAKWLAKRLVLFHSKVA